MNIIEKLLTINPYSRPGRKLPTVTAVALHYVGNPGSTAIGNRNYFESLKNGINKIYASSHYIIGLQGEVIKCIPETEYSYATNSRNCNTISIEICHPKADGKFNAATYAAAVELVADICKRYNLNPMGSGIIRHYDVTKKLCPLYFVNNPDAYQAFRQDVYNMMNKAVEKTTDHWCYTTYKALNKLGLYIYEMKFDSNCTRAEVFTLIARALNLNMDTDIPNSNTDTHWAAKYYEYLNANGIAIQETRYADSITRGEAFVIISGLVNHHFGSKDVISNSNANNWADPYYSYLNTRGMKVSDQRYSDNITRAEIMSLIYRALML